MRSANFGVGLSENLKELPAAAAWPWGLIVAHYKVKSSGMKQRITGNYRIILPSVLIIPMGLQHGKSLEKLTYRYGGGGEIVYQNRPKKVSCKIMFVIAFFGQVKSLHHSDHQ